MPRLRALAPAALTLSLVAVPVASAAPTALTAKATKKVPVLKLHGGHSTLALDPAVVSALEGLNVGAVQISGAEVPKVHSISFTITSGTLLGNKPGAGSVRHNGGLRLFRGASQVDLNNLRIMDGKIAYLTTQIGSGKRIRLARLDVANATSKISRTHFRLSGVTLVLAGEAAQELNQAFATTLFTPDAKLGTLTTDAKVRIKLKRAHHRGH